MNSEFEERSDAQQEQDALLALDNETPEDEPPVEDIPPRFVVKTKLTAQLQLEASTALAPKVTKWLVYICLAMTAGMLGFCLWMYFTSKDSRSLFYAVLLLLVGAFIAYQKFLMPKLSLKKWEQAMISRYGTSELHLTAEFFEHSLAQSVQETDNVEQEGYSALSRIVETEHLFLLRRNRTLWFFIEKSGFCTGTAEEFLPFLQERIGG